MSATEPIACPKVNSMPATQSPGDAPAAPAWPHGAIVSDNTLDSYLRRIRAKVAGVEQAQITTVRGVGYRWS